MSAPRILFLDIETRPMLVHAWQMRDVNVSLNQVMEFGGTICVGAGWAGEKVQFFSDWTDGHRAMLEAVHKLWCEADVIIGYNHERFDLRKLRSEMAKENMAPPPPVTTIDLYRTVRSQFGLDSNKLDHVAQILGLGSKIKHEGHGLWTKVLAGDPSAQKRMERYCVQDVRLTERVYRRILPWINNHPHLGCTAPTACGSCGSARTQRRGVRRTKASLIERVHCQACGSWQDGSRAKAA